MARHTARGLLGIIVASLTACAAPTSIPAQPQPSAAPAKTPASAPASVLASPPATAAPATPAPATAPAPLPAPAREAPIRPAAILWPVTKLQGIDYVDVRAIAKAFDLKAAWTKPA